jgi:hypothetical protein
VKFAKIVFWAAGGWGVLVLAPLYFLFDRIGRQDPPAITHPQFFYGFAGVAMAWQVAFVVIATNPVRFRPMMIPSVLEKLGYVATVVALHLQGRVSPSQLMTSIPDALLGVLFLIAFQMTREAHPS